MVVPGVVVPGMVVPGVVVPGMVVPGVVVPGWWYLGWWYLGGGTCHGGTWVVILFFENAAWGSQSWIKMRSSMGLDVVVSDHLVAPLELAQYCFVAMDIAVFDHLFFRNM